VVTNARQFLTVECCVLMNFFVKSFEI